MSASLFRVSAARAAGLCLVAPTALAQNLNDIAGKKAVGVGIFYGTGEITVSAPPDSATAEVKGYSAVLPRTITGSGPALGLSFGRWGVVFGGDDNTININKPADVSGTPGNLGDDPFVRSARRVNRSISILWQPYRWVYFGLGQDNGTISFEQVSTAGVQETRRFNYASSFYSLGLAFGFDPSKNRVAPIVTVFTKVPTSLTPFSGVTNAVGLGMFF